MGRGLEAVQTIFERMLSSMRGRRTRRPDDVNLGRGRRVSVGASGCQRPPEHVRDVTEERSQEIEFVCPAFNENRTLYRVWLFFVRVPTPVNEFNGM